ncbi:MAG TPA: DUF1385 domain-containing protein [Actinobacteria bacterium]|nr:DUF1385 domain-containing protein [Actinomycetota bacterium]
MEGQAHKLPRLSARSNLAKVPLIRGVLVLMESLTLGFRALSWSAQRSIGEEEEPLSKRQIAVSMSIALVFFLALFMVLPLLAARFAGFDSESVWFYIIEAVVRIALFVLYIWAIGRSKEIARVFQYHGAEHMTIHAYEHGDALTRERISKYRPEHPRCGTSFLLIVMLTALIVFTLIGSLPWYLLITSRIVLIPVIGGLSYEVLKIGGAKVDGLFGRMLTAPGLWLQRLTTSQPEPDMIDVAVASLLFALSEEEVVAVKARGALSPEALSAFGG